MIFFNWQRAGEPKAPYTMLSPNLRLILTAMIAIFGGFQNGGYNRRPIRGSTSTWSDHAFGAAYDWQYGPNRAGALAAIDWLIANHERLGVQVIHDYYGSRMWDCDRGWRAQAKGSHGGMMGQSWATWLHVGTNPDNWARTTPLADRGVPLNGATPTPPPVVDGGYRAGVPLPPLRLGSTGIGATQLIDALKFWGWYPAQWLDDRNDGTIGARADAGIKAMQQALGVPVDGIYGPRTATAYGGFLDAIEQLATPPPVVPAGATTHTVAAGESWWAIAKTLGVSIDELTSVNRTTTEQMLHPGDVLAIPGRSVKVAAGDGWIRVAKLIGVTEQALRAANPTVTGLHPGMFLADPRAVA